MHAVHGLPASSAVNSDPLPSVALGPAEALSVLSVWFGCADKYFCVNMLVVCMRLIIVLCRTRKLLSGSAAKFT